MVTKWGIRGVTGSRVALWCGSETVVELTPEAADALAHKIIDLTHDVRKIETDE